MWVYVLTFLLSLILYRATTVQNKETQRLQRNNKGFTLRITKVQLATLLAAIPLILISGLRYSVGTDYWNSYYSGFYRVLRGNMYDSYEPVFYLFIRAVQICTDNVFVFFFLTAVLFCGFVFKAIYEQSENIPLSIILFFLFRYYFISMNAVRELLAIAVIMYGLKYVYQKDLKRYALCCIIAGLIHKIGFLMICVYFINKIEIDRKRFIMISAGMGLFSLVAYEVLYKLLEGTKYGRHMINYNVSGIKVTLFTIVLNIALTLIAFSSYEKNKNDEKYRLYLNMEIIATLVAYLFATIPLAERVYWLFSFTIIISFPYFIKFFQPIKYRKLITLCLCLVLCVFYIAYDIAVLNDHEVLPYQSIINQKPVEITGWR